jgi:hypothetical protein
MPPPIPTHPPDFTLGHVRDCAECFAALSAARAKLELRPFQSRILDSLLDTRTQVLRLTRRAS